MNKEVWKDIEGYEGLYAISNYGQVKRLARVALSKNGTSKQLDEKILTNFKGNSGYIHVNLWKKGKIKQFKIHRLMMNAFVDKPNGKNVINHIDGNKSNNTLENLEWCTHKENSAHAYSTGLAKGNKGYENSQGRLTNEDVINIRNLYDTGNFTHKQIGLMFDVSRRHVCDIVNGKRWGWLQIDGSDER